MQPMPFCLLKSQCSETRILASSTFSVHQKVSMLSKICIVSKIKIPANTNTNNIQFQKVTLIRILVFGLKYSNNIRIPNYSLTSGMGTAQGSRGAIGLEPKLHSWDDFKNKNLTLLKWIGWNSDTCEWKNRVDQLDPVFLFVIGFSVL